MKKKLRRPLLAALLAAAGTFGLEAAAGVDPAAVPAVPQGPIPQGPVYAQDGPPPGATWAVDPRDPGSALPPVGRSLFDYLTIREEDGRRVQRVAFPFSVLLAEIEARLGVPAGGPSPLQRVLIPLGRSLQRNAADPEFFRFPRAVVAVDSDPAPGAPAGSPPLKDRLYLGYHEKAAVLEVISYNEAAGRFEFQLVRDYRPGGEARVVYANRAVCTACHQGGSPLFSRPLWQETNANPEVSRLLAAEHRDFYGFPVAQGVDGPAAFDAATDRANRFAVYQLLWREGCGEGESERAVRCRAAVLTAALQHRLSGGRHHDALAPRYREAFLAAAQEAWQARWPRGLALPDPDVPNRDPLATPGAEVSAVAVPAALSPEEALRLGGLVRRSHVPARFEPLNPRQPLEVWTAEGQGPERLVAGLAELLGASDARQLDAGLFALGNRSGKPRKAWTAPCEVTWRLEGEATGSAVPTRRIKLLCGAEGGGGLALAGRIYLETPPEAAAPPNEGAKVAKGTIERLEVAGSALRDLAVTGGRVKGRGGRHEMEILLAQDTTGLHPRRADGNALEKLILTWGPPAGGGEKAAGEATAIFLADFDLAVAAIDQMAERTAAGESDTLSDRPFRRTAVLRELSSRLGLPAPDLCCDDEAGLPPPLLDPESAAGPDDFPEPAIKAFYRYCAGCHATPEASPPNFLYGDPPLVRANLASCAERIFFRLDVWSLPAGERPKTPMPPIHALPGLHLTAEAWPMDSGLALLRQYATDVLRAGAGSAPRLRDLAARGYESLHGCLPAHREAAR